MKAEKAAQESEHEQLVLAPVGKCLGPSLCLVEARRQVGDVLADRCGAFARRRLADQVADQQQQEELVLDGLKANGRARVLVKRVNGFVGERVEDPFARLARLRARRRFGQA